MPDLLSNVLKGTSEQNFTLKGTSRQKEQNIV